MPGTELIECPGCGQKVHPRANDCPACGFRSDVTAFDNLLSGLTSVSSILVGFGLAALVSLATSERRAWENQILYYAAMCWSGSSIALLVVLVHAEFLRKQLSDLPRINLPREREESVWQRCVNLLWIFTTAVMVCAIGVVLIGFFFSPLHGVISLAAVVSGLFFLVRTVRL